jgi:CBS domain-containing protein
MLGFGDVYDYVPGKVDWLAHRLGLEGERAAPPTVGRVARDDVARCRASHRVSDALAAIEPSPYPFALVTTAGGILVGRLRASAAEAESDQTVGEVMELAPSTVRPHRSAKDIATQLGEKDLRWAIVTTPEGQLIGVASREDLERAS